MIAKREFGELELIILKTFEGRDKLTVKEVLSLLGGEDKYTTIMTVMNRMVEKGALERKRDGLQYQYWVVASSPSFIERMMGKFFDGRSASVAAYLIESGDVSEEELSSLEALIKKRKRKGK